MNKDLKQAMSMAAVECMRLRLAMSFELLGFALATVGVTLCALSKVGVGFILAWILGAVSFVFAWRFCARVTDFVILWIMAAQRGTIMALIGKEVDIAVACDCEKCKGKGEGA